MRESRLDLNGELRGKALNKLGPWTKIKLRINNKKQKVSFGADIKLTLREYFNGNTDEISKRLFKDLKLKMIRIPLYAHHNSSGDLAYDSLVSVLRNIKKYNNKIELFGSIANGTYTNGWLHGEHKFPEYMRGCCDGNIYKLDLKHYVKKIDNYVEMLERNNLKLGYFGFFNEDQAKISDYKKIIEMSRKLNKIKIVGNEAWGIKTSIKNAPTLDPYVDIQGSHIYDDEDFGIYAQYGLWKRLKESTKKEVWHTESTRLRVKDTTENLIEGLINIFPAINAGVSNVILYQTFPKLINRNGEILTIKYNAFRHLINRSYGKNVLTSQSSDKDIFLVSFMGKNKIVSFIVNNSTENKRVKIDLPHQFKCESAKLINWNENQQTFAKIKKKASDYNLYIPKKSFQIIEFTNQK